MQCPERRSTHIRKNGENKDKQNHICVDCGRQFIDCYETAKGYTDFVNECCLQAGEATAPAITSQQRPSPWLC